ncbi:selenium-dependent xanthine dehydrogenase [Deltaproteobacteria bacterium]|nr:selenium-dependent xanthine dehydrogenase [Deltaproteobacteria bacterium]
MADTFSFSLDGATVSVTCDPKAPALEVLREQLGVVGVKAGCSPQGMCGCCTVLVDGKPRLTCTLPTKSLAGKTVTTLASVSDEARLRLAGAFATTHAAQCGYCTPAIVLSASTLLALGRAPTDDEVHRALAPHTCRCTGYTSIKAAIGLACAPGLAPFEAPDNASAEVILGLRPFVDDLHRPGTLHAAVVLAPVSHGTLLSIDAAQAQGMPGNVRVIQLKADGQPVRYAGELLAAVVADTRSLARAAAAAVRCDVEATPAPTAVPLARAVRREGTVEPALSQARYRAELEISLAATDAVPLEPESALALPEGGGLLVYSSGHDARGLAERLGAELGVPVRVVLLPSGGSYGARAVAVAEAVAAKLSLTTGSPVSLALEHEEGTRLRARRAASVVTGAAACDEDGRLLAARVNVRFAGGATAHEAERMLARAIDGCSYHLPNLEIIAELHQGPGSPTGPLRGAGPLPVAVVIEALLDQLASAAGVDPFRIRALNALPELEPLLSSMHSASARSAGPLGAALFRTAGGDGAEVVLTVTAPDEVEVQCNVPELGQGRDRQLVEALVRATGLPEETFVVAWADSSVVAAGADGPVDVAAFQAGSALAAAGGSLRALVGRRFVGRAGQAPAELAGCLVRLGDDGGVAAVEVFVAAGEQDPATARSLAEGGAAMGLGIALAEEVPDRDGAPESRFRYLGTLKSKLTPRIVATPLEVGGSARGGAEAATVAAAAATFAAVRAFEGAASDRLPAKASRAAASVGVRIRGSVPASG